MVFKLYLKSWFFFKFHNSSFIALIVAEILSLSSVFDNTNYWVTRLLKSYNIAFDQTGFIDKETITEH